MWLLAPFGGQGSRPSRWGFAAVLLQVGQSTWIELHPVNMEGTETTALTGSSGPEFPQLLEGPCGFPASPFGLFLFFVQKLFILPSVVSWESLLSMYVCI